MGWGRMMLLGNIGQQLDIGDLDESVNALRLQDQARRGEVMSLERRVEGLTAEVDELRLYVAVLLRIVTSRGLITSEQLQRIVNAIDLSDGTADGRYKGKPMV